MCLVKARERLRALADGVQLVRQRALRRRDLALLLLDRRGLAEQGTDLPLVGPAEDIGAPVINTRPVILLVPSRGPP